MKLSLRRRSPKCLPAFLRKALACLLIYALLASQTFAFGAVPGEPAAGSKSAGLPITPQQLLQEAIGYFLEKRMGNVLPINLDSSSALPTVPNAQLPGGPFHGKPLALTPAAVSQPLAPGDYELPVMAYCTQFSVHRPGRNAASVMAPLSGTQAKAIGNLLWRGTQAGKQPQELQDAAWAIQNGATFDNLTDAEKADVMAFAPEARAGLEEGFSFDKPLRDLYNTIVANPRPYILQYKHENGIKFPPDIAIPNIKFTMPTFDEFIAKVGGPVGKAYERAVEDRRAYLKYLEAKQHKQEHPFVAPTDPPMPPTEGPWTARVPGRVYMRAIVQGGNLQSDNILQIRVVSASAVTENRLSQAHFARAGYQVPQVTAGSAGPSVLALMGAPADILSPAYKTPTPVRGPIPTRDPIGPVRDPIPTKPVEPPTVFPGEPTVSPGEILPGIEGAEGFELLNPDFDIILFMMIAAQALIITLGHIQTRNETVSQTQTRGGINTMRLQLQLDGKGVSRTEEHLGDKVLTNTSDTGVTLTQVGNGLNELYQEGTSTSAVPARLNSVFRNAIIEASSKAQKIRGSGGINQNNYNCVRATFTDTSKGWTYRVDIENISGWNLRQ